MFEDFRQTIRVEYANRLMDIIEKLEKEVMEMRRLYEAEIARLKEQLAHANYLEASTLRIEKKVETEIKWPTTKKYK